MMHRILQSCLNLAFWHTGILLVFFRSAGFPSILPIFLALLCSYKRQVFSNAIYNTCMWTIISKVLERLEINGTDVLDIVILVSKVW